MSRTVRVTLGAIAATVLTAATLLLAVPAGSEPAPAPAAAPNLFLGAYGGAIQAGTLQFGGSTASACDTAPAASAFLVGIGGVDVTAQVTVTVLDTQRFLLSVPGGLLPTTNGGNQLQVALTCAVASSTTFFGGSTNYYEAQVTKAVTGDAPAGAEFTVQSVCTGPPDGSVDALSVEPSAVGPVTNDLKIAAGGSTSVFSTIRDTVCTFAETDAQGAITSTVDPGSVTMSLPLRTVVTVTNQFPVTPPKFTG